MTLTDHPALVGVFTLRVFRRGVLVERYEDRNMIVDTARSAFAHLVAGDGAGLSVAEIGFGETGTGPSPDDESLSETAYSRSIDSYTFPSEGNVAFAWSLGTGEANGLEIREFGLLTGDGTLIARKTRGVIEKSSDLSLDGTWTIIF